MPWIAAEKSRQARLAVIKRFGDDGCFKLGAKLDSAQFLRGDLISSGVYCSAFAAFIEGVLVTNFLLVG